MDRIRLAQMLTVKRTLGLVVDIKEPVVPLYSNDCQRDISSLSVM